MFGENGVTNGIEIHFEYREKKDYWSLILQLDLFRVVIPKLRSAGLRDCAYSISYPWE